MIFMPDVGEVARKIERASVGAERLQESPNRIVSAGGGIWSRRLADRAQTVMEASKSVPHNPALLRAAEAALAQINRWRTPRMPSTAVRTREKAVEAILFLADPEQVDSLSSSTGLSPPKITLLAGRLTTYVDPGSWDHELSQAVQSLSLFKSVLRKACREGPDAEDSTTRALAVRGRITADLLTEASLSATALLREAEQTMGPRKHGVSGAIHTWAAETAPLIPRAEAAVLSWALSPDKDRHGAHAGKALDDLRQRMRALVPITLPGGDRHDGFAVVDSDAGETLSYSQDPDPGTARTVCRQSLQLLENMLSRGTALMTAEHNSPGDVDEFRKQSDLAYQWTKYSWSQSDRKYSLRGWDPWDGFQL